MDNTGRLFEISSTYRPDQRDLQMTREHVLELDEALNDFGRFAIYSRGDNFALVNNGNILTGIGIIIVAFVGALALFGIRFVRRRRSRAVTTLILQRDPKRA